MSYILFNSLYFAKFICTTLNESYTCRRGYIPVYTQFIIHDSIPIAEFLSIHNESIRIR